MTENDDKRHLENVLRSLELPFLSALAEHQSEERLRHAAEREARANAQSNDPKGEAAPSQSGSEGGGGDPTGETAAERVSFEEAKKRAEDPNWVHVWVRASREQLDQYIDAVAHVIDHRCEAGRMVIDSFTGRLIEEMVREAHTKGWYENDISLMDSDEFRAYRQWLIDQDKEDGGDADNPEGEAGTD